MMHDNRLRKILLPFLLVIALLAACGGEPAETNAATSAVTTPAASADAEAALPQVLAPNLVLAVDLDAVEYAPTASVTKADRVLYDYETKKEFVLSLVEELQQREERYDAIGRICVADSDQFQYVWNVHFDYTSDVLSESRGQIGVATYRKARQNIRYHIPNDVLNWQMEDASIADGFFGSGELSDLPFDTAFATLTELMVDLGVPTEAFPELDQTRTYALSVEDQIAYINTSSHYGQQLCDPETGEWVMQPPELSAEDIALLSDSYVMYFRQSFGGIPLTDLNWARRKGGHAITQSIGGFVSADGSCALYLDNLVVPGEQGAARQVVSPKVVVENLKKFLTEDFPDDPYVRGEEYYTDHVFYLSKIELCYAIFEPDARDELVLYPYWVIPLEKEYTDAFGNVRRKVDAHDIFAFNAFTGELVDLVTLPKE